MNDLFPSPKLDKHSRDVFMAFQQEQIESNRSKRLQEVIYIIFMQKIEELKMEEMVLENQRKQYETEKLLKNQKKELHKNNYINHFRQSQEFKNEHKKPVSLYSY